MILDVVAAGAGWDRCIALAGRGESSYPCDYGSSGQLPALHDLRGGKRTDPVPTVLRVGSWRFHFYSDEGQEPPHIHVDTGDGECKFWLMPVRLSRAQNVASFEVRRIEQEVSARQAWLLEQWHAYFRR